VANGPRNRGDKGHLGGSLHVARCTYGDMWCVCVHVHMYCVVCVCPYEHMYMYTCTVLCDVYIRTGLL
jgi:hypothetical protein